MIISTVFVAQGRLRAKSAKQSHINEGHITMSQLDNCQLERYEQHGVSAAPLPVHKILQPMAMVVLNIFFLCMALCFCT